MQRHGADSSSQLKAGGMDPFTSFKFEVASDCRKDRGL
jgi:hypothetical protein